MSLNRKQLGDLIGRANKELIYKFLNAFCKELDKVFDTGEYKELTILEQTIALTLIIKKIHIDAKIPRDLALQVILTFYDPEGASEIMNIREKLEDLYEETKRDLPEKEIDKSTLN